MRIKLKAHGHTVVSIPNGLPRPFSRYAIGRDRAVDALFQSRTGFPGHLASASEPTSHLAQPLFQSRTGFPGHLAADDFQLPRFHDSSFNPERASQAI